MVDIHWSLYECKRWTVWIGLDQIQSLIAEIRQGKKKKKKQDENIMVCPIP